MIERNPNCNNCPLHETICQNVDNRDRLISSVQESLAHARDTVSHTSMTIGEIEIDVIGDAKAQIAQELEARGIPYTEQDLDDAVSAIDRQPILERVERLNANSARASALEERLQVQIDQNNEIRHTLETCDGPTTRKRSLGRRSIECSSFRKS